VLISVHLRVRVGGARALQARNRAGLPRRLEAGHVACVGARSSPRRRHQNQRLAVVAKAARGLRGDRGSYSDHHAGQWQGGRAGARDATMSPTREAGASTPRRSPWSTTGRSSSAPAYGRDDAASMRPIRDRAHGGGGTIGYSDVSWRRPNGFHYAGNCVLPSLPKPAGAGRRGNESWSSAGSAKPRADSLIAASGTRPLFTVRPRRMAHRALVPFAGQQHEVEWFSALDGPPDRRAAVDHDS